MRGCYMFKVVAAAWLSLLAQGLLCSSQPQHHQIHVHDDAEVHNQVMRAFGVQEVTTIAPCGDVQYKQSWSLIDGMVKFTSVNPPLCLTAVGPERDAGVITAACNTSNPLQEFILQSDFHLLNPSSNHVLDVSGYSNTTGARLHMWTKTETENQKWKPENGTEIVGVMSGKCLSVAGPPVKPCTPGTSGASFPYCNPSLTPRERAMDLVSRVTDLQLKANQLQAGGSVMQGSGFPAFNVSILQYSEALHGAVCPCITANDGTVRCPSSFPHALATSASLNKTLWGMIGEAVGIEARAIHNLGQHCGPFLWAPDVNLIRDPRWGRAMEVPGEDGAINGEYVSRFIYAMQYGGVNTPEVAKPYQRVVSQPKHAIVYNLEGFKNVKNPPYNGRSSFNAIVNNKDLVEYYLLPWRAAITKGVARGCMCSVNQVNGVPGCANQQILHNVFKESFNMSGSIVTDGGACGDPNYQDYLTRKFGKYDPVMAAKVCVETVDTELGQLLVTEVVNATEQVGLNVSSVDNAVIDIYEQLIRAGTFESIAEIENLTVDMVDNAQHRQIALESAEQSFVLLKNEAVLPFHPTTSVALIGPHYNATTVMQSNYFGQNNLVHSNSPLQALQAFNSGKNLAGYLQACDLKADGCANLTSPLSAVTSLAQKADAVIVIIGLYPTGGNQPGGGTARESEAMDRMEYSLQGQQAAIVEAALQGNKNVVVVMMNGGQVALPPTVLAAPAIFQSFYPGELGGPALVNVLFGQTPVSGRLPYTIYGADYQNLRNMSDASLTGGSGTTYMYYDGDVQFPFGIGLSYTTWRTSESSDGSCNVVVTTDQLVAEFRKYYSPGLEFEPDLTFNVTVSNTGTVASPVSLMAFSSSQVEGYPKKRLLGFERVESVPAGESQDVRIGILPFTLTTVSSNGAQVFNPQVAHVEVEVGDNQTTTACTITITGPSQEVWRLPQ